MAYIGKEYKFVKHENFDGFLRAVGVPEDGIKKFMEAKSYSQKLVQNGDSYTYITTTAEGAKESTFKSGVEFEDTIQNSPIKSLYTVDGNTVTQVMTSDKGTATFKREYNGDDLVVTITASPWDGVARRYYKA